MKILLEILVAVLLHPLAFILALINILGRDDLDGGKKLIWGVICVIPIGPILYVAVGDGSLW
jgi:hypothetical protein